MDTGDIFTLVGLIGVLLGGQGFWMLKVMGKSFNVLDVKIDGVSNTLSAKIEGLDRSLSAKIDGIGTRLELVERDIRSLRPAVSEVVGPKQ